MPDYATRELRKITGYDPTKYRGGYKSRDYDSYDDYDEDDDMEAGFEDIEEEENYSRRVAKLEDKKELKYIRREEEEEEEMRRKKLKKHKK